MALRDLDFNLNTKSPRFVWQHALLYSRTLNIAPFHFSPFHTGNVRYSRFIYGSGVKLYDEICAENFKLALSM